MASRDNMESALAVEHYLRTFFIHRDADRVARPTEADRVSSENANDVGERRAQVRYHDFPIATIHVDNDDRRVVPGFC